MTKKMAKRFLAVITATIIVFSMLPLAAMAYGLDDDHDHEHEIYEEVIDVCEECGFAECVCEPEDKENQPALVLFEETETEEEKKTEKTPDVCGVCKETDCEKDHVKCAGCGEWDHDCFEGMTSRTGGSVSGVCPACGKEWHKHENIVLYFSGQNLAKVVVYCDCGAVSTWINRSNNGAKPNGGADNNIQLDKGKADLESVIDPNKPVDKDKEDPDDKDPGETGEPEGPGEPEDNNNNKHGRPGKHPNNHHGRPHGRPNTGGDIDDNNDDEDEIILDDDLDPDDDDPDLDLDDDEEDEEEEDEEVVKGNTGGNNNSNSSNNNGTTSDAINAEQAPQANFGPQAPVEQIVLLSNPVYAPLASSILNPVVDLDDNQVPTAAAKLPAWALMNLILAILTGVTMTAILLAYFGKKSDEDEEIKRRGLIRLLSIIPAIAAVILFMLTEDMRNTMILTDNWTVWMAAIAIVQTTLAALSIKKTVPNDQIAEPVLG